MPLNKMTEANSRLHALYCALLTRCMHHEAHPAVRQCAILLDRHARFLRFCFVGVANCAVDFAAYAFLSWLTGNYYASRAASWGIACLFSYFINRSWTFRARDKGLMPIIRFSTVNLISLGLGLLLLYAFQAVGFGYITAYFLSLPFTIVANYVGYRFWSFKEIG